MSKGKSAKGTAIKQIEMRRCVVCRQVRHKSELLRVVKNSAGEITLDETTKSNVTLHPDNAPEPCDKSDEATAKKKIFGRGAYVCRSPECVNQLQKRRNFDKVFKLKVPDKLYDKIKETIRM